MFYNTKIFLLSVLIALFAQISLDVNAQGVVSLSDEAMNDDKQGPGAVVPKGPGAVMPKAPGAVMPKGPGAVMPKGPGAAPALSNDLADPFADDLGLGDKDDEKTPKKDKGEEFEESEKLIDNDLFNQMSEIEKKTVLLNLELRREKLQTEIEAVKNQRQQALVAEEERKKALELQIEKEKQEMEKQVLAEKEKLRLLDIEFEKIRQESLLSAYKTKMLEEKQNWISENANFYKTIKSLRESNKSIVSDAKKKMETLASEAQKAKEAHDEQINVYRKQIKDQNSQLSVLRNRITRLERERDAASQNPFATAGVTAISVPGSGEEETSSLEPVKTDLSQVYVVIEIRGQGNELVAKLHNKNGTSFYVKKGTVLQTGHVINEINTTYVMAIKEGEKSYLYFSAGGILPAETLQTDIEKSDSGSGLPASISSLR